MERRHRRIFRHSSLPSYQFSSRTNWQLRANTTQASRISKHLCRGDANMPSYYRTSISSNHSTSPFRHKKPQANQSFKNEVRLSDQSPRRNLIKLADIVQSTDTIGLSAENDCETKQPATTILKHIRSPNNKTTKQKHNRNTMPNWFSKFVVIKATQQRIAATEYHRPLPTGACHTTDKPQQKTGTFDAISEGPTTTPTQQMT